MQTGAKSVTIPMIEYDGFVFKWYLVATGDYFFLLVPVGAIGSLLQAWCAPHRTFALTHAFSLVSVVVNHPPIVLNLYIVSLFVPKWHP